MKLGGGAIVRKLIGVKWGKEDNIIALLMHEGRAQE